VQSPSLAQKGLAAEEGRSAFDDNARILVIGIDVESSCTDPPLIVSRVFPQKALASTQAAYEALSREVGHSVVNVLLVVDDGEVTEFGEGRDFRQKKG